MTALEGYHYACFQDQSRNLTESEPITEHPPPNLSRELLDSVRAVEAVAGEARIIALRVRETSNHDKMLTVDRIQLSGRSEEKVWNGL